MQIPFIKCHGSNNDFLLIDETEQLFFQDEWLRKLLCIHACDRKNLIGADGVLFLGKNNEQLFTMRMFNPDGSEAEMCGNGIRCIGRLAFEKTNISPIIIRVGKQDFLLQKEMPIADGVHTFSVIIPHVTFTAAELPLEIPETSLIYQKIPSLSTTLYFTALGMPNPHLAAFVENEMTLEEIDALLVQCGEHIKTNKTLFPKGFNVSLCKILSSKAIYARTFERGVGLTNSCGTAMAAASVSFVLKQQQLIGSWIDVVNKGGKVKCLVNYIDEKYSVQLLGNATFDYIATIDFNRVDHTISHLQYLREYTQESIAYQAFLLNNIIA